MKNSLPLGYLQIVILLLIAGISFLLTGLFLSSNFYENKIFPRTFVNNIDISGLSITEAIGVLEKNQKEVEPHNLVLIVDDIMAASSSAELEAKNNYSEAVNIAYSTPRDSSKIKTKINLIKSFFNDNQISTKTIYKDEKLDGLLSRLNKDVLIIGENPDVSLKASNNENSIVVNKGVPGREVDFSNTKKTILERSEEHIWNKDGEESTKSLLVDASVASTSSILTDEQVNTELNRAKKLVGKFIEFKAENKRYYFNDMQLIAFLQPKGDFKESILDETISAWSDEVNRKPQNAEFKYDQETLNVETFVPHKDGLEIDKEATKKLITDQLSKLIAEQEESSESTDENSPAIDVPLNKTSPEITLEKTNNLGIKERIGFGESYYQHSIPNRVHNVGITAERISLTIVPPKEEFSFNKTLGEVSAQTGYRSAYVISQGKTVLGDGGGVCQVSSTLFRSVLDAGLKITKRLQHSYRVAYYELNSQPGFDATVYSGDIDFKFTNDTENYILIYAYVETENRYMNVEIYGTSDGRTSEISSYKKWDFRNAPAPEYYPTTELPSGVTEQIDWAVSGIKTEFTQTVKDKFGNVISEETYYSNYRPWSAKYMRGI